mmetsp:Transcript_25751/g.64670  ORF Transcript_25751/g.64670 Transcript_25751/m.64670 type:complete len:105 (-) Transcript_25751:561-875(-)
MLSFVEIVCVPGLPPIHNAHTVLRRSLWMTSCTTFVYSVLLIVFVFPVISVECWLREVLCEIITKPPVRVYPFRVVWKAVQRVCRANFSQLIVHRAPLGWSRVH